MKEKYTFFWHGIFSQWAQSRFIKDSVYYNNAEQYMMFQKAILFNDTEVANAIIKTTDPKVIKKLGRKVKNFDEIAWLSLAKKIVYDGNYYKFTQNSYLLERLLDTVGTTLVEASPYDNLWGIGLSEDDPRAKSRETWKGKNWLGEILTALRKDLIKEK